MLVVVDFEDAVYPSDLKKIVHPLLEVDKSHLASPLPDDAITTDQFAHSVTVDEIHAREIKQKVLMAVAGEDVDQVTQSRATVTQCESPNSVHNDDVAQFSGGDFKGHASAALCFQAESYP